MKIYLDDFCITIESAEGQPDAMDKITALLGTPMMSTFFNTFTSTIETLVNAKMAMQRPVVISSSPRPRRKQPFPKKPNPKKK